MASTPSFASFSSPSSTPSTNMSGFSFSSSSTSSATPVFGKPSVEPTSFLFGSNPSNRPASFTISAPSFDPELSPSPTSSPVTGASSAANISSSALSADTNATGSASSLSKQVSEEAKTDPIVNAIRNCGLNISLEAKNESASLPTEITVKSENFSYTRILKGITHNPHFTALHSYSKRSRERLIVGWDEIFEEAIDQIQSLTTKAFSTNVHDLLKTIAELENLGYNVARLRKRLDELTEVMNKRNSSEVEILDLKAKADDYRKEKKKIESDIADLQAQEDMAQVMVDELVDRVDKMESNLLAVDALFENIARSPV